MEDQKNQNSQQTTNSEKTESDLLSKEDMEHNSNLLEQIGELSKQFRLPKTNVKKTALLVLGISIEERNEDEGYDKIKFLSTVRGTDYSLIFLLKEAIKQGSDGLRYVIEEAIKLSKSEDKIKELLEKSGLPKDLKEMLSTLID